MRFRLPRAWAFCLVYVALHVAAHLSAAWFEIGPGISIWYPPSGLALTLLVLLGPAYAPVVLAANLATALTGSSLGVWWAPVAYPVLITAHYSATAWFVRRTIGPRLLPGGRKETWVFGLAVLLAPALIAAAGTALSTVISPLTGRQFGLAVLNWWIGDASGLLTVVPTAMVFAAPWLARQPSPEAAPHRGSGSVMHALVPLGVLLASLAAVLTVPLLRENGAFYLCFLPLVWICIRHGLPGATLATLAITMAGLVGLRLTGSTAEFVHIFLLFELAVAGVGLGLGTVVTRRAEAEKRLADSQARLDRVLVGSHLGLWEWYVRDRRIHSNHRLAEILGYRPEEIEPLFDHWERLLHPDDLETARNRLREHLEDGPPLYEAEYRMRTKDGGWRWIHSRGSVIARDERRRALLMSGTHSDVTDRKLAELQAGRLLRIMEATPDFIVTTDAAGRIGYANAAFLELSGLADPTALKGRPLADFFPEKARGMLADTVIPAALDSGSWHGELVLVDCKGHEIPTSQVVLGSRATDDDGPSLSFIIRNISQRKQAERESVENERKILVMQKNESLGVLAGGIAHDFNNLLTSILGNASLVRGEITAASNGGAMIDHIEQAVQRAAALCQQLLAYAGHGSFVFSDLDLNQHIRDTRGLLEVSLNKKIAVEFDFAPALPAVRAATVQLQQVVMNLVINAAEAVGDREGAIAIRTTDRQYSEPDLRRLFPLFQLTPGRYVRLQVADNGCGMPPTVLARIFEPFYTTKPTGHGLGLAAVLGIVKSHGGAIRVESTQGRGTTFEMILPALERPAPAAAPAASTWPGQFGQGLVLVVDDEPGVRHITARYIESFGLTPIVAADGIEAISAFREHGERLRLVVLDVRMPRMDGVEAFGEMFRLNPRVPVILMSGFSHKPLFDQRSPARPAGMLAKPFDREALRGQIEAALIAASAG